MVLLAVESLDAAGPELAVDAPNRFAQEVRIDGFELSVCVVIWWARHACDSNTRFAWRSYSRFVPEQMKPEAASRSYLSSKNAAESTRQIMTGVLTITVDLEKKQNRCPKCSTEVQPLTDVFEAAMPLSSRHFAGLLFMESRIHCSFASTSHALIVYGHQSFLRVEYRGPNNLLIPSFHPSPPRFASAIRSPKIRHIRSREEQHLRCTED